MEIHLCPLNILHGNYQRWHKIYNDIRILAIFPVTQNHAFGPAFRHGPISPHLSPHGLCHWWIRYPLQNWQLKYPVMEKREWSEWQFFFSSSCGIKLRTIMAADSKIFHSLPVWIKNHMWMLLFRGKALILQQNWSCVMSLNNAEKKLRKWTERFKRWDRWTEHFVREHLMGTFSSFASHIRGHCCKVVKWVLWSKKDAWLDDITGIITIVPNGCQKDQACYSVLFCYAHFHKPYISIFFRRR